MSASCDFHLKFYGSDEEFNKLVDKLYEIEGKPRNNNLIFQPFTIKEHEITAFNGSCHNIWGDYYLQPDADMYLELAKNVPDAAFEVHSHRLYEGGGGGCETFVNVVYKDHKLVFRSLPMVDEMSFTFIVGEMYTEFCSHEVRVAIAGKSKLFDTVEELEEYINDWDGIVDKTVTTKTEYLICNNSNLNTTKVRRAKELGIPIVSEMKFVRMFCDIFDFEDEQLIEIVSDITYEEFCERFTVDNSITPDVFSKMLQNPEDDSMIITTNKEVSLVGNWEEKTYILNKDMSFSKIS